MGARSSKNTTQNNRSDGHLLEYFRNTFVRGGGSTNAPVSGLTATGGVISDYTDGPAVYRAHIFTSSGTFTVSALGNLGSTFDLLTVAGGGGGGGNNGGGSGGGGVLLKTSYPTAASRSYTITIGAGGAGSPGANSPASAGIDGGDTTFVDPSGPTTYTAGGGGGGGSYPGNNGSAGRPNG